MKNLKATIILCSLLIIGSSTACTYNSEPSGDPDCTQEMSDFGDVVIYGSFAHDLGCSYHAMTIDGKEYGYNEGVQALAKEIVKKGDEDLLLSLINRLYYEHDYLMHSTDEEAFEESGETFSKPVISKTSTGYKIMAWIKRPAQMLPEEDYDFNEISIDKSGKISVKNIKSFHHDI